MLYETTSRVERMDIPEQSSRIYKTLSNTELEKLVESKAHAQRADPDIDELFELNVARARLRIQMREHRGNHLKDMCMLRELNERIWAIDKKEHIRAMANRRI